MIRPLDDPTYHARSAVLDLVGISFNSQPMFTRGHCVDSFRIFFAMLLQYNMKRAFADAPPGLGLGGSWAVSDVPLPPFDGETLSSISYRLLVIC